MRKVIATGATALALFVVSPAPAAFAQEQPQQVPTTESDDDNGEMGLWGLAGLLGLAGLAGLMRRDRRDYTSRDRDVSGSRAR
jgi:MYXO-CTERM domain-containing protein